jgi:sugar-specific transcriptional regulator TrmB
MIDTLQKNLENIGLTKQESRCYLALYILKESKAGKLAKEADIDRSNIYAITDSLVKKGIISYKIINNVKVFMLAPAQTLQNFIEEKELKLQQEKIEIQETINKLTQISPDIPFTNFKYYEKVMGIRAMFNEIGEEMKRSKPSTFRVISGKKGSWENLRSFYDDFHALRSSLNHKYELVLNEHETEHAQKRKKNKFSKIKMLPLENKACLCIFKDYFFTYYSIDNKPVGFLIKDQTIADSYSFFFDLIWKQAKEV